MQIANTSPAQLSYECVTKQEFCGSNPNPIIQGKINK